MTLPIALQLYTVRDFLQQDFAGTVERVASFGYRHVELAGLYEHDPTDAKAFFDEFGLRAIASHEPLDRLTDDLPAVIEQAKTFGYDLIACPWLDEEYRSEEGYRRFVEQFNQIKQRLAAEGMTAVYHNHAFEFEPLADSADGLRGMEIIFDGTEIASELDVYWVEKGGDDALSWMRKLSGRLPLLHMKDMADDDERGFAEVGTGTLALDAIAAAAPSCGVQYFVIEQDDNWMQDAMESARVGFENLSNLLGQTAPA